MTISLLHPNSTASKTLSLDRRVLYHLSLDRVLAYVCADVKKREYFLKTVTELTDDQKEILYRREILQDFTEHPMLFDQLVSLFDRFYKLTETQKNAGRTDIFLQTNRMASLETSRNSLQTNALCLKRALLFVKGFDELLSAYPIRATGLQSFGKLCQNITHTPNFEKLLSLCKKYETFSTNGSLDFQFHLDDSGYLCGYALIDHKHIRITDPDLKKKGFHLFGKTKTEIHPCAPIYPDGSDFYEKLAIQTISDFAKLFSSVAKQVFEAFIPLRRELDFYGVALDYRNALSEKGIPLCFPKLSTKNSLKIRRLYDLYLVFSQISSQDIIPNDIELSENSSGLLVFGRNGSGKTVYLRSIGCMQLLAQAGLPIPAESGEICLFSQIATQFSESEGESSVETDAGRFEQEVRALAAMVETLQKGSLVLLNETFQSTAYAEGAEGLYHLLHHFSLCGIRFFLVSHLRELESLFAGSEVTVRHTGDGYTVK